MLVMSFLQCIYAMLSSISSNEALPLFDACARSPVQCCMYIHYMHAFRVIGTWLVIHLFFLSIFGVMQSCRFHKKKKGKHCER